MMGAPTKEVTMFFHNPRADLAKKRSPASSPSRLINAHIEGAVKQWGRECKWCGTWEQAWPANQFYICIKCE